MAQNSVKQQQEAAKAQRAARDSPCVWMCVLQSLTTLHFPACVLQSLTALHFPACVLQRLAALHVPVVLHETVSESGKEPQLRSRGRMYEGA